MSLNKGQDRIFNLIDGNVLTTGGTLNLANGQLAILDLSLPNTQNGRRAVNTFSGKPKDTNFQIKMGVAPLAATRSISDKPYSSLPFKLSEVVDYKVFAPKVKGIKNDSFIIGYNGKAGTEIVLSENTSDVIDFTLSGEAIGALGYQDNSVRVSLYLEYPYVDADGFDLTTGLTPTMQQIIENAVDVAKRMTLMGGVSILDYIDIAPVNSLSPSLADITNEVSYTTFKLTLVDNGDQTALGRVQAQYPLWTVLTADRLEDTSTVYTVIAPTATVLADFTSTIPSYIKGCEDCTAGYSEVVEGVVYSISIEDDGVDVTASIDDVPGFVTGTVIKQAQNDGVGIYTVVVDNALTEAEIAAFKAANALKSTSVFSLVGDAAAVCENATVASTAWVAGAICNAIPEEYTITLSDDECGTDKLAELQAAYPDLSIAVATVDLSTTITLTGTSGTANVNVEGVSYLSTFNTSLTITASDFVTAHAAAILAATGATVTSSGATLIFVAPAAAYPSLEVINVTTDLAGTVAAAVGSGATTAGMCQTTYRTSVLSNIVCEDCSDEFRDLFVSEAPRAFDHISWEKAAKVYDPLAKMGIKITGKDFIMSGSEEYLDEMPFYATSTRISIAGGYTTMISENFIAGTGRYAVKMLSIAEEPEAYGGMLRDQEERSRIYFDGTHRLEGNNYGKWAMGQTTRLKGLAQYVDYALTVNVKTPVMNLGTGNERITYIVRVEVGYHNAVETLLNKIAAAAGLPAVQAYA